MNEYTEHILERPDCQITCYETGNGPPLLFLHGSYDSLLLRPFLDLFAGTYRCITFDQRGAERSPVHPCDPYALHVERFIEDIEALRVELALKTLDVVGHSWGATLGLLYAGCHRNRVSHMALAGMGPLDEQMSAVYRVNVLRAMGPENRRIWPELNEAARRMLETGEPMEPETERAYARCWSHVMFHSDKAADRFVKEYFAAGGLRRRAPNAVGLDRKQALKRAKKVQARVLVLYGYQDYEPIAQAFVLKDLIPQAKIAFLNECGHMVYGDQPELTFKVIDCFLKDGA